eukprot:CAMPEP_0179091376 /NCGR_PEP_ID=MMETSP0796-20121207/41739_1 /TAXON_ID=73915 /ORGANISM="Pyrodinium bahamense, Strain pbaha01" /LENGTH=260 /DNA_ID=CAMNT_0020788967 /DNA_START=67 /DNA_END=849 /DNA_ORIENTATION=-
MALTRAGVHLLLLLLGGSLRGAQSQRRLPQTRAPWRAPRTRTVRARSSGDAAGGVDPRAADSLHVAREARLPDGDEAAGDASGAVRGKPSAFGLRCSRAASLGLGLPLVICALSAQFLWCSNGQRSKLTQSHRGKSGAGPAVRLAAKVRVRAVSSLRGLNDTCKARLWWQPGELEGRREGQRVETRRNDARKQYVAVVLREQARQLTGTAAAVDEERLAEVAQKASRVEQRRASKRAERHHEQVSCAATSKLKVATAPLP